VKTSKGVDHGNIDALTADTLYYVRVVAKDKAGNSSWSNVLSAKTKKIDDTLGSNNIVQVKSSQSHIVNDDTIELSTADTPKVGDIL